MDFFLKHIAKSRIYNKRKAKINQHDYYKKEKERFTAITNFIC